MIYGKFSMLIRKGGLITMAKNVSSRSANIKNLRSKALNSTKKKQSLNLQVVTLDDGSKVRMSQKEIRTLNKKEA